MNCMNYVTSILASGLIPAFGFNWTGMALFDGLCTC